MNKTFVILAVALVAGLALAPTAAASCPPSTSGSGCGPFPVTDVHGCLLGKAMSIAIQVTNDCL